MYNAADYLAQTIESVRKQTYTNWEIILIDDGSKDDSLKIALGFAEEDDRITVLQLLSNVGMAEAINKACKSARGQYIAFLDSDDVWLPEKLEKQVKFMQEQACAISCTSYVQMSIDGTQEGRVFKARERVDYRRVLLDCPVGHSTVMYDVSKLGVQVVPNIRKRSDDALWLQILKKESYIWGLQETLVKYRVRGKSLSSNKISLVKYHWKLYREIEHLDVFRSAFHIAYWGLIKILRIK